MADADITNEQLEQLARAAENAKAQFGEMSDEHKQATKNLQNAALAQNRNTKATQANTQSAYTQKATRWKDGDLLASFSVMQAVAASLPHIRDRLCK